MTTKHETANVATLTRSGTTESLGLPARIRACLFDLDGVLTQTALLHAAAWKETFDGFLRERTVRTHEPFVPFDVGSTTSDTSTAGRVTTACAISSLRAGSKPTPPPSRSGDRKNERLLELIHRRGVAPYPGSVTYLRAVCEAGLRRAVVSASANCRAALEASGLADLFDVRIDAPRANGHAPREAGPRYLSRGRAKLDVEPRRPRSSRTPSPESPPDGPAGSDSSSGSIGSGTPTRFDELGHILSSPISPSCWGADDWPHRYSL